MPEGSKVGDAYISIYADIDRRQWTMAGDRGAEEFGIGFGKALPDHINKNLKNIDKKVKVKITPDVDYDRDPIQKVGRDLAQDFTSALIDSTRPILKAFPGQVAEVLASPIGPALLAIALPAISFVGISMGAALGGAILTGLSGIVLAGGLVAVFKNAEAKAAASELGNNLMTSIAESVKPLVPVVIDALSGINHALQAVNFDTIFDSLAPGVTILGNSLEAIIPTVERLINKLAILSAPLMGGVGEFLEKFAPAFERFVDKLASVLPQLSSAFTFLGNAIIGILDYIGDLIQQFGTMWGNLVNIIANGLDMLAGAGDIMAALGIPVGATSDKLHDMATNMRESLVTGGDLSVGTSELTDSMLALEDITTRNIASLDQMKNAMNGIVNPARDANVATQEYNKAALGLMNLSTLGAGALDINTVAGIRNREQTELAISKSKEKALAEIVEGKSVADATAEHEARIATLIKQNFNDDEVIKDAKEINATYGLTPKDVSTLLTLVGFQEVSDKMSSLKAKQISLWKNVSVDEAKKTGEFQGHATGGYISGAGSGTSDSIMARLSNGEYVIKASSVKKFGTGFLGAINDGRKPVGPLPAFATGGPVGTTWPFAVDVSKTLIEESWADGPMFGGGGNLGSGGRSVEKLIAMVKNAGLNYTVNSTDRPGDPGYHGQGKAVDFGGDMRGIARMFMSHAGQMLEVIHGDSGSFVKNGKVVGANFYGAQTVAEHSSWGGNEHVHTAMNGDASASGGIGTGQAIGGMKASANLASWISQAAKYVGIEWYDGLVTLIMRESGGNPGSINLTDSNAIIGTPSMGLMQTIGPTFAKFRSQALPNNPFDPIANIVAGMNYVHSRYGSLFNVQQAHSNMSPMGYDNGGWLPEGLTLTNNQSGRPEAVFNPSQLDALTNGGGDHNCSHTIILDGEIIDAKIESSNGRLADALRRGRGRG